MHFKDFVYDIDAGRVPLELSLPMKMLNSNQYDLHYEIFLKEEDGKLLKLSLL